MNIILGGGAIAVGSFKMQNNIFPYWIPKVKFSKIVKEWQCGGKKNLEL